MKVLLFKKREEKKNQSEFEVRMYFCNVNKYLKI